MINPREYQAEIINRAAHANTIAFLPTGTGKTLIACHLIGIRVNLLRESGFRKWIVFIAPKRVLLSQQVDYLRKYCPQQIKVEEFTGSKYHEGKHIDYWTAKEWGIYLDRCEVLGMTPAVLERLITHDILPPHCLDFVILDECHHAIAGNDPMGRLCDALYSRGDSPLLFGMTASPVKVKKADVVKDIGSLQRRLKSTFFRPSELSSLQSLDFHTSRPRLFLAEYESNTEVGDPLARKYINLLNADNRSLRALAICRLRHSVYLRELHAAVNVSGGGHSVVAQLMQPLGKQQKFFASSMLAGVSEALYQISCITDQCGPLCGLIALETSIKSIIHTTVSCDLFFQLSSGLQTEDVTPLAVHHEVDVDKLTMRRDEILSGPFSSDMKAELYDQRLAVCKSVLELFISLLILLGTDLCASAVASLKEKEKVVLDTSTSAKAGEGEEENGDSPSVELLMDFDSEANAHSDKNKVLELRKSIVKLVSAFSKPINKQVVVVSDDYGCLSILCGFEEYWSLGFSAECSRNSYLRLLMGTIQWACSIIVDVLPLNHIVTSFGLNLLNNENSVMSNGSNYSSYGYTSLLLSDKIRAFLSTWARINQCGARTQAVDILEMTQNRWIPVFDGGFNQAAEVVRQAAEDNSAHLPTTIVFCKMQLSVLVLHSLFEKLFDCVAKLDPQAVKVGCGRITGSDLPSHQRTVLADLKQGKIQILFTTAVAEEGIDISSCNVVLNFNCPETVTSLIQRRGRARSKDSIMLFLLNGLSEEGQRSKKDLLSFSEQEEVMGQTTRLIFQLGLVEDDEIDPSLFTSFIYRVPNTDIVVDTLSAITIFHKYCQTLNQDDFYRPSPIMHYTTVRDDLNISSFRCSLLLPSEIPVKDRCLVSPLCAKKMIAKGAVLLQAVKALYEAGELDEKLLRSDQVAISAVLDSGDSEALLGEGSRIPVGLKETPSCLAPPDVNDSGSAQLFFFSVSIKNKTETIWSDISPLVNTYMKYKLSAIEDLCLVLPHPVPSPGLECAFKCLLFDDVTVELNFNFVGSAIVSKEEIIQMQRFHHGLLGIDSTRKDKDRFLLPQFGESLAPFNSDITIEEGSGWTAEEEWSELCGGVWIATVPVTCLTSDKTSSAANRITLNLSKLRTAANEAQVLAHNLTLHRKELLDFSALLPTQPLSSYLGTVVSTSITTLMCPVEDLMDDLCLESVIPKRSQTSEGATGDQASPVSGKTFAMHFEKKYPNLPSEAYGNKKDRMFPAYSLGKRDQSSAYESLTLISSESTRSNKKIFALRAKQRVHFYPKLALPLGKAHWLYVGELMQSVTRIVTSACLACEATQVLVSLAESQGDYPEFVDNPETEDPVEGQMGLKRVFPDAMLMLEALSPKIADAHFNSERLEMLGDTILKYAVTIELFNVFPMKNESFLTSARSRIICNDNLCHVAQRCGLLPYVRVNTSKIKAEEQGISWKRAADLIEALLGAYYLVGGVKLCCQLMKCVGLWPKPPATTPESLKKAQPTMEEKEEFAQSIPVDFDPTLRSIALGLTNGVLQTDEQSLGGLEHVQVGSRVSAVAAMEGIFGYKFRDEGLLNEALTHGSVPHSRSNQRLEFLGDAVLDFVVVSFFFCADNSLREGGLSVTKSSLTCNENLAAIAIKLGLYRHLVHYSLSLQEVFSSFAQQQEMDKELQQKQVSTSKVLADLFEAIVGAIFLDSQHDVSALTSIMQQIGLLPLAAAPGSTKSQYGGFSEERVKGV